MLFIYLLGFFGAVDRAFATATTCPATKTARRATRRHASDMIYGEAQTCSGECMAKRDASEYLKHEEESTMATSTTSKPPNSTTQQSSFCDAKASSLRTGAVSKLGALLHPLVPRADPTDLGGPNVELAENKAISLDFSSSMSTQKLFDTSIKSSRETSTRISLGTTVTITNTRNPWQTGLPGFGPGTPVAPVSDPPSSSSLSSSTTQLPSASTSAPPPFVVPALSKGKIIGVVVGVIAVLFAAAMLVLLCRRFVVSRRKRPPSPPLDTQLVGFPYPAPRLSPPWCSMIPGGRVMQDTQTLAPNEHTAMTDIRGCDRCYHVVPTRHQGGMARSRVKHECTCAPQRSSVSELGFSENRMSRSTIDDILSGYASSGEERDHARQAKG
ncbi:hypothetical protein B0J13DRAFT_520473 [Dactylonectria estremocensis]|uniref:Mid2 domain-containing protein n=1 Tax=Dactylonectria estremocensis TaxID=1079267 RepID=A0A9P9FBZ8_9HYPO|nr:hypothetical protein B0J13DRAFT_520473 [Dactylonectria estremocensis]